MTTASQTIRADAKVIGLVSVAHMHSHFALLAVPPLFFLVKDDFGVGFAALGFAMTMLYVMSGVFQTVAGFLVDRFGGKTVLVGGMAVVSAGLIAVGLAPTYAALCLAMMLTGLGNSVFHPADLAILNAKVEPRRLGYAFSIHGVSGTAGFAIAPLFTVGIAALAGWRNALIAGGALGLALAAIMASQQGLRTDGHARTRLEGRSGLLRDLRLLTSAPVLSCFAFFIFSALASAGLQTFSMPTIISLYGVTPVAASATLTGYLVGGAVGTLLGGIVASRTRRHGMVAVTGILVAVAFVLALATGAVPVGVLAAIMMLVGLSLGFVYPSRDIIVREVTPPHARGKVYGFVYSGLDLGAAVGPPVVGWLLDRGEPQLVFFAAAATLLLGAGTMVVLGRRIAARA